MGRDTIVPPGYCQCRCGEPTPVGLNGKHWRFLGGHARPHEMPPLYEVDGATGCWTWQRKLAQGYGTLTRQGVRHLAHRYYYEQAHGIPVGSLDSDLDHLCRNRACVNPDHLEPISRGENVRRGDVAVLDWEMVTDIREAAMKLNGSERGKARMLAEQFPVAESTVRGVIRGARWPESDRPAGRRGAKAA